MAEYAAVVDDLKAALVAVGLRPYELDEVPGTPPDRYVEVHLSRRFTDEPARAGGHRPWSGWRLSLRFVSKGSASNLHRDQDKARAALLRDSVTLDGVATIVSFESEQPIGPRDNLGFFDSLVDFTFSR